jgi:2-polyprenyl-3-methyl-5-hydroxy-6-metoxy-1,4-benzoquinol methylase
MSNPLLALIEKHVGADLLPRAKRLAVGLAQDFWKDGAENPFKSKFPAISLTRPIRTMRQTSVDATPLWHAAPGEISEKMWGAHFTAVGDVWITDALVAPLNLTKNMSVLDLSAGLGGRLRQIAATFGAEVTGLESDAALAKRGVELSMRESKGTPVAIASYDPENFSVSKKYDCILARELFYHVADKSKFFAAIAAATNGKAHLSFTDYIINPENADSNAVKKWLSYERGAVPLGLVGMAEAWAKAGFMISVHDDQTDLYLKEIMAGLRRLAVFLASGVKPDTETKKEIQQTMELWAHRAAALEQGMKFYCFYGNKL